MANYLTMALDPNAGNIHSLMRQQVDKYDERIMDLEDELVDILASKNITILELFHRVAIRLETLHSTYVVMRN
jgi:hypothetical protein